MKWLVVGLGNPGKKYENTRHNLGKQVLRCWRLAPWQYSERFAAEVNMVGEVAALWPRTGMNESGRAAAAFARVHNIRPEHIIIVHDDVELPFGEIRFKEGGSAAGHNGVRSVLAALGTEAIGRLRIGIGRPAYAEDSADEALALREYVLQPFTASEEKQLPAIRRRAAEVLQQRLNQG